MLRQAIGLKSVIFEAPGNLGTKVRIVAFAVAGRKHVAKKFFVDATTSAPIVFHEALKKAEVSPSGPGALFGFNLKYNFIISSSDGIDTMLCLRSSGKE